MDEGSKASMRLYLRSERARGLNAVPAGEPGESIAVTAAPARIAGPQLSVPGLSAESPAPRPAARSLFVTDPPAASASASAPLSASGDSFTAPILPTEQKRERLATMNQTEVRVCTRCRLSQTRTNTVFGEGDVDAKIFFIGEGPGETEDKTGRPFVGRAGELLNKMIAGMGLAREQVYIANIVKCRPPNNRVPAPDEVATCTPYLQRQLEIIRPRAIITLGLPATQYMLQTKMSMGRLRGQWHAWRGIKLMPTYHPAYVLRNPTYETRAAVWSDLKQVLGELGLPVPKKNV